MVSLEKSAASNGGGDPRSSEEDNALCAIVSASSTSSSGKSPLSIRSTRQAPWHSLMGPSSTSENSIRKRSPTLTEHSKITADKADISMPSPVAMPSNDWRLSTSLLPPRGSEEGTMPGISPASSVKGAQEDLLQNLGVASLPAAATTATDVTPITTSSITPASGSLAMSPPSLSPNDLPNIIDAVPMPSAQNLNVPSAPINGNSTRDDAAALDVALPQRPPRSTTSSSRIPRRPSGSTVTSVGSDLETKTPVIGKIGVCALDVKARSRPSRSILTRLQGKGEFEVIVFGDKVILDEGGRVLWHECMLANGEIAFENWPICDFLISFFSDGFPLDKAISYVKLRKPFVVNDLPMQKVLWDRRLCLRILDKMGVPTPKRIEVNRDGGPRLESADFAQYVKDFTGVVLDGPSDGTGGGAMLSRKIAMVDDGDILVVDGKTFKKPFVEKPVNGEDHNVMIYFPRNHEGGGGRRLFRKVGNKSSEYDPNLVTPRCITEDKTSYIYEQFLVVKDSEDVKVYTVGPDYCHAETRKSPVVDGFVQRNLHGKEIRYITNLSKEELSMASKIARGFGQRICGFDLLRTGTNSYVIDVNGWSFVKDNDDYYANCSRILRDMFMKHKMRQEGAIEDSWLDSAQYRHHSRHNTNQQAHASSDTALSHRSTLKTILKSPSMTKLSNHIHSHNGRPVHGATSPDAKSISSPMGSPPGLEKKNVLKSPSLPKKIGDDLPPPIVTTTAVLGVSVPDQFSKATEAPTPMPSSKHSWKLKGMVNVIRHADRTPKQKFKFTFHSQVFVELLKGHREEILLKGEAALASVETAVRVALEQKLEDMEKLQNLRNALSRKGGQPGTKVQIKPMFRKRTPEERTHQAPLTPTPHGNEPRIPEDEKLQLTEYPHREQQSVGHEPKRSVTRNDSVSGATFSRYSAAEDDMILDKLQLVMKWGGEPTHSARYQAQDLGANMRDDLKLMNKETLSDVRIFTSSERRVKSSAQIWASSFLAQKDLPDDYISVRKDLLDDSNAAKDVMDKVKKKLKLLLREGKVPPEQFSWPKNTPEPSVVLSTVSELMKFHRRVMRHNFKKLSGSAAASLAAINGNNENKEVPKSVAKEVVSSASIQARWCTGEDEELFKERWEKLFTEFCQSEKVDPSKISELYDSMKFDALHNKPFLEWVFMPSQSFLEEIAKEEAAKSPDSEQTEADTSIRVARQDSSAALNSISEKSFAAKIGLRRKSVLAPPPSTPPLVSTDAGESYFKLYGGSGESKSKKDTRLSRLRELYRYAKILFDYIGPQEYGISDAEKLEIGLLTSLPLLREIVQDLEELQASGDAKSFIYFTKESHIYTLLNCILEGGIQTKISRATIPELDYLSQICFELYEAKDSDTQQYKYSIRISISPGCHTFDPLDVSLDSKHAIGSAPRRSLTAHQDYSEVIETLRAKFDTVKLPKNFLAVNLSDKHAKVVEGKPKRDVQEKNTEESLDE